MEVCDVPDRGAAELEIPPTRRLTWRSRLPTEHVGAHGGSIGHAVA